MRTFRSSTLFIVAVLLASCGGGGEGGAGGGTSGPSPNVPISNINVAPVSNAGVAQSVLTGTTVTLDGSASSDANGDSITYQWTLSSKPIGSTAVIANASTVKPTFTADVTGSYVLSLVVNDGRLSSTAEQVTVTAAVGNVAPVAVAGVAQNVITGTTVTLDGTKSSDANGDLLTYAWTLTSKPNGSGAVISRTTSATPTFTADLGGVYVATLQVSDGKLLSLGVTTVITADDPQYNVSTEIDLTPRKPLAIAVNSKGAIYVADGGSGVVVYPANPPNKQETQILPFNEVRQIAIDAYDKVIVVNRIGNTDRIIKFEPSTGASTIIAELAATGSGSEGVSYLATDYSGNIFVSTRSDTVRKISSNGISNIFGPTVSGIAGSTDPLDKLRSPTGIVSASNNSDFFVADTSNNIIRKFTFSGAMSIFAGTGLPGRSDGDGISASFYTPQGLARDLFGNIFVADSSNGLIRKINRAGKVSTIAGGGSGALNGTGLNSTFSYPESVAVSSNGDIFVGEANTGLIRKLTIKK